MTEQLTTQNATITTATIQVQALTIGRKQVTQSVFRQLPEDRLFTRDGATQGAPWGRVNFHPGKCDPPLDPAKAAYWPHHAHVVWQFGKELRRATIWAESFDPEITWIAKPRVGEIAPPGMWQLIAQLPQLFIAV